MTDPIRTISSNDDESLEAKMLQVNRVNIAKKLKAGKTLTANEQRTLERLAKGTRDIYPSMKAAAAAMKIPLTVISFAVKNGCEAMLGSGRIDGAKLREWIDEHADELRESSAEHTLKDQKTIEEIRKLKLANDIKEGRYTLTADAEAVVEEQARECQRVLYQMPDRLAPDLAGLGPVEIAARLNKAIDEAMECLGKK